MSSITRTVVTCDACGADLPQPYSPPIEDRDTPVPVNDQPFHVRCYIVLVEGPYNAWRTPDLCESCRGAIIASHLEATP